MKKLLLISMLVGAMPLAMMAQDDDLYFVAKKKKSAVVEEAQDQFGLPKDTYYAGSNRSVDEYNRRFKSQVEQIDSVDSLREDFELTKRMSRFDEYQLDSAYWAGYRSGRETWWGWHSPWYYSRWGWYDPWYDPWYFPYYSSWYWYDPWYYGYAGWYDPWYYRGYWGWRYPYYRPVVVIGGGGGRAPRTIGTGTIRRDGSTRGYRHGYTGYGNMQRNSSLRQRANAMSGGRTYSSGNNIRSAAVVVATSVAIVAVAATAVVAASAVLVAEAVASVVLAAEAVAAEVVVVASVAEDRMYSLLDNST